VLKIVTRLWQICPQLTGKFRKEIYDLVNQCFINESIYNKLEVLDLMRIMDPLLDSTGLQIMETIIRWNVRDLHDRDFSEDDEEEESNIDLIDLYWQQFEFVMGWIQKFETNCKTGPMAIQWPIHLLKGQIVPWFAILLEILLLMDDPSSRSKAWAQGVTQYLQCLLARKSNYGKDIYSLLSGLDIPNNVSFLKIRLDQQSQSDITVDNLLSSIKTLSTSKPGIDLKPIRDLANIARQHQQDRQS
jgi:hypothetical protein